MKRAQTPSFLIELPLQIDWSGEKQLRAHLETARCLYNALLGEANKRLRLMRNDPAWQAARIIPHGKTRLRWKESRRYQATRRQHANTERRIAAHRKSLHGKLAHAIVAVGNTVNIEKTSFKGWQKQHSQSMGLRAPGMFVAHLARIVAKTGGTLTEVSAFKTKLSQYCHQCGKYVKKPRSQRWHRCPLFILIVTFTFSGT
jgi:hypothetical protein